MDNLTQSQHKSLSIRINSDGLSFCVYSPSDTPSHQYKMLPSRPVISLAANVKEALMNETALHDTYQRVNVLMASANFTTVPSPSFEKEDIHDIYHLLFPQDQGIHVSYNILRRSDIAIIFGMDRNVYKLILDDFPRARFYSSASTLLEFFSDKSNGLGKKKMYVYLHDGLMTVYCYDDGHLLFVNNYVSHGVNDCLYYIMHVWSYFGYDQLRDSLEIIDDEGKEGGLLSEKISQYIKDTIQLNRNEEFREQISDGKHFLPYDLQTLLVCGD